LSSVSEGTLDRILEHEAGDLTCAVEAELRLSEQGFGIGLRAQPSTAPQGTILNETPVNELAPRGSDVILDVATPPGSGPFQPSPSPTPSPTP